MEETSEGEGVFLDCIRPAAAARGSRRALWSSLISLANGTIQYFPFIPHTLQALTLTELGLMALLVPPSILGCGVDTFPR